MRRLLEGVMHPSGSWMRDFRVSIISLVLLKEVMQPSGSWMRDFHASVISLVLFLEGRLGDAFWCGKVRVGFWIPVDLLERFLGWACF